MFEIMADSACDLTPAMAESLRVKIVPFYVSMDGTHYQKESHEVGVKDFYQYIIDHPKETPRTSLPSVEDYRSVFEQYAKAGKPLLCIPYTAKMSGSYGSACNARQLILEEYPEAQIVVHESAAATVTHAIVVQQACAMRDAGLSLEEAVVWLNGVIHTNQIFFTVGNLDYLIRGGRIGKATGKVANVLNIRPMIHFTEGEIFSGGIARGRNKSMEKCVEQLLDYLEERKADPDDYAMTVGYGYEEEEGKRLRMQIQTALRAKYPKSACEVDILQIGCTIAVHTGPYPLGVGVMRRWKAE